LVVGAARQTCCYVTFLMIHISESRFISVLFDRFAKAVVALLITTRRSEVQHHGRPLVGDEQPGFVLLNSILYQHISIYFG
ncbi:hypothetical protein ACLILY_31875, partial [Mycobacterium sp. MS3]|uniref:hypothetical protein n=1 Tax=Mycobacterium sp. MS3 TaxID=3391378 RepID=UPI003989A4EF